MLVIKYLAVAAGLFMAWQAAVSGPYMRASALVSAALMIVLGGSLLLNRG